MSHYQAPLKDMQFVLHSMLDVETHLQSTPVFDALDRDTIDSILDEAGKFTSTVLAPLNAVGDEQGCKLNADGSVTTPDGFVDAWKQFTEAGWPSLSAHPDYEGQGLPATVQIPVNEMVYATNQAWGMYAGLTRGAYECIAQCGSDEVKSKYLPKLATGEWTGTMCLTEAHAGTDLGMLRTRADPQSDGSFLLTGTKIFISAGEHDFADNIIHLVLGRVPDAPAGTRGISLFVVPRNKINDDGSVGERNGVRCSSLEHKMGIHGNATCVIDLENAQGWLVGELNRGLPAMFVMMNEARLGVGLEGLGLAVGAYQRAAAYAHDRIQGRAPGGPVNDGQPADSIIHHPDVRRMLLTQKAYNEGGRMLAYWTAQLVDIQHGHPDEARRAEAKALVELLTPVVKAFLTDNGMLCTNLAIQVLGGHGYIWESGVEQYFRDVRIKPIYEGTNGIQSLDLLGRKILMDGGERLKLLAGEIQAFFAEHASDEVVTGYAGKVAALLKDIADLAGEIGAAARENPSEPAAAATDFMRAFGHLLSGYLWCRAVVAAQQQLDAGNDPQFHQAKLATARFYFARLFPEARYHLEAARGGADSIMGVAAEAI